jgi:hypothetical protein
MDPYLEAHWRDVHLRMIIHAAERLQETLPKDLRARVEERVFIESPLGMERSVYPDIRVVERPGRLPSSPGATMPAAAAEPLLLHVADEPVTEGFIEIREAGTGGQVVSVIEILSLSNKLPGEGQDLYRRKQRELRRSATSLVEIDLLRAGRRVLMLPPEAIPASHRTTYQVCVRRAWRPGIMEVYRVPLREALPTILVPLRERDPDAPLDLQAILEHCYDKGGYDDIDYSIAPDPPLETDDLAWAEALLRDKGLRK